MLSKSHKLTLDYLEMDKKLREIDGKIKEIEASNSELEGAVQTLEKDKHEIKLPYELKQKNFENFFSSYFYLFSLFDFDHAENQVFDHV